MCKTGSNELVFFCQVPFFEKLKIVKILHLTFFYLHFFNCKNTSYTQEINSYKQVIHNLKQKKCKKVNEIKIILFILYSIDIIIYYNIKN